jgi:glycosyltransferase involved in cell wall biosynthesis
LDKKNIWIISQYAIPVKYGFGTRHFFLGKEFAKKGMNVHVIASSFNKFFEASKKFPADKKEFNFEEIDGVNTCWVKGFKYKNNDGLGRMFSWLVFTFKLFFLPIDKLRKPDVIILSSLSLPPIIAAVYLKKRFKAKLIFEIRDIWPQTLIDVGNYSTKNPLIWVLKWIERFGYKNADHITATMPRADLHIKEVLNQPFQFTCIPQGINLDFFNNLQILEKKFLEEHIPSNKFIIGYAGTLGKANGLETIIETFKDLAGTHPQLHLVLLGDGPLKERLTVLAAGAANITFVPKVNRAFVNSFLQQCNLLYDSVKAVPLYRFGSSQNKWMDYMYSGKPMLVSYTGFLSLINEAGCGIAVPSEDKQALKDAIIGFNQMDAGKLTEMGLKGKEFVLKHRSFDKLAENYLELF